MHPIHGKIVDDARNIGRVADRVANDAATAKRLLARLKSNDGAAITSEIAQLGLQGTKYEPSSNGRPGEITAHFGGGVVSVVLPQTGAGFHGGPAQAEGLAQQVGLIAHKIADDA